VVADEPRPTGCTRLVGGAEFYFNVGFDFLANLVLTRLPAGEIPIPTIAGRTDGKGAEQSFICKEVEVSVSGYFNGSSDSSQAGRCLGT